MSKDGGAAAYSNLVSVNTNEDGEGGQMYLKLVSVNTNEDGGVFQWTRGQQADIKARQCQHKVVGR